MRTVRHNVSLAAYTTLHVGGNAEFFVAVTTEKELDEAVCYAQEHDLPITVLGGGSNVLISDEGVSGLVIHNQIEGVSQEVDGIEVKVTAGAGEVLDSLVSWSVSEGYWGLENLSHIPGSVGATPIQNVGAYGVEVKDVITAVKVYDTHLRKFVIFTNEECQFGYRDSYFKHEGKDRYIVSAVTYTLSTEKKPQLAYKDLTNRFSDAEPTLQDIRDAVIEIRSKKFPDWTQVGTAGSFFKNPILSKVQFDALQSRYPEMPSYVVDEHHVKIPLAWILDKVLGLRGEGQGSVGQYEGQALVLINNGAATADTIVTYAQQIVQKVYEVTGIEVQWEVTRLGM